MKKTLRILCVEDQERDAALLTRHLSRAGYDLASQRVETAAAMRAALESQELDVILCDYSMPQFNALSALAVLKETGLDIPLIIISGTVGEAVAVEAMRAGANDYLMKDNLVRLAPTIEREVQEAQNRRARRRAEEALKASEAELVALFAALTDVIFILDAEGRYLTIAPTSPTYLYKSSAEMVGKTLHEVFPREQADFFLAHIRRALDEGRMCNVEYSLQIQGTEVWFDGSVSPMSNDSVIWIARDITQHKRAEEQLRRQLDFTRAITASLGEGVYALDESGRVTFMNHAAEAALGWVEGELLGQQIHEIIHFQHADGLHRPANECPLLGVLSSGQSTKIEGDIFTRRDGTIFPVSYTSSPIITDERVVGAVLAFHDITERKRAEQELSESEERYRDTVENARDIIYTHDLEGNYTSVNKAGEQITGYTREEACTLNLAQTIAPEYLERARQIIARKLAGEEETVYDLEIIAKSGRRIAVEVNSRLVFQDGVAVGVQGIARDVTERKLLEEQLRQSQKMESIGVLAGGVAHDFNNLLTAILGNAQLAARRLAGEDPLHQRLEEIKDAAHRAARLTRQLLAFSRRQHLERRPINLNGTVGEIMKMVRRIIGEDVEVRVKESPALPPVYADSAQVEQVVMNLAVNARDAMPGGGSLALETRAVVLDEAYCRLHPYARPGRYVELCVSDTGVGMDAATRERIFEPFFTTKAPGKGTGLGLAMVYGIVKQHDGHINVQSEPGQGTTFKVYLPVAAGEAEEGGAPELVTVLGGTETILVAEDEEALRRLVKDVLEDRGYRVLLAKDGEEAVEMYTAARGKVDLLLLDVVMPRLGGQAAYERIRLLGNGVPAIFMTGYSIDTVQDRFVKSDGLIAKYGAALIQKPYTVESLGRTVREVLDGESMQ